MNSKAGNLLFIIFTVVSFFAFLPPAQLYYSAFYLQNGRYLKLVLALIICLGFVIEFVLDRKWDRFLTLYALYSFSIIIAAFLYGSGLKEALWTHVMAPGSMLLFVRSGLRKKKASFLNLIGVLALIGGVIYMVPNVLSIAERDVQKDFYIITRANFLNYIILGIAAFIPWAEGNGKKQVIVWAAVFGEALIALILGRSLTMIITVGLFGLWFLFPKKKINLLLFAGLYLVMLIAVIYLGIGMDRNFLGKFLVMIGKYGSFQDRALAWQNTLQLIAQRPLFGFGAESFEGLIAHIHPHNEALYLLFRRGMIGVGLLVVLIVSVIMQIDKVKSVSIRNGFGWLLFCIAVGGLVEVYNVVPMIMILTIMFYYSENCEGALNER